MSTLERISEALRLDETGFAELDRKFERQMREGLRETLGHVRSTLQDEMDRRLAGLYPESITAICELLEHVDDTIRKFDRRTPHDRAGPQRDR